MHGVGILVMLLIRVAVYFANKRVGKSGRPQPGWLAIMTRSRAVSPWIYGLGARGGFLLFAWLIYNVEHQASLWFWLCLVGAFPQLVLQWVLVPSGIPHASYHFTRVLHPQATLGETRGGAIFNELRARLRWGWLLTPTALAPLAQRVLSFDKRGSDLSARAASLSARAILDALSGDNERARELFVVVQNMSSRHASRFVRAYAQAWLLTDAARRGAYQEVIRLSRRGPRTVRRAFMRGAARRILGQGPAPARWKLILLWLCAPGRTHTHSLLKLALGAEVPVELSEQAHDFAGAKRATFELLRLPRGRATRGELSSVARAWQSVFDSGQIHEIVSARRDALQGTFEIETVTARFEREVIALLGALLPTTLPDGEPEETLPLPLLTAMDQLQGDLLGELEDLVQTLPRGQAKTSDDLPQHWRTWARIRFLAQELMDILPERAHLIFPSMGLSTLNHGAWLYNQEKARILAHDVFRFLAGITPAGDPNWKTITQNAKLSV